MGHSALWQWRQTTSFSKTKKRTIPAKTVDKMGKGAMCSSAWDINPRRAAARRVPVAYEIKQGIRAACAFSSRNRKRAAAMIAPTLPKMLNNAIHSMSIFLSPHVFLLELKISYAP
jgi:hypothetical protein